jgi:hypothetical protein
VVDVVDEGVWILVESLVKCGMRSLVWKVLKALGCLHVLCNMRGPKISLKEVSHRIPW